MKAIGTLAKYFILPFTVVAAVLIIIIGTPMITILAFGVKVIDLIVSTEGNQISWDDVFDMTLVPTATAFTLILWNLAD